MSLRPSEAQQVELCAYAAVLRAKGTPTASRAASFGRAFAAYVAGDDDAYREALTYLSADEAAGVSELGDIYYEKMPLPRQATHEWTFALKRDGTLCDWEDPERVTRGAVDHWWQEGITIRVNGQDAEGQSAYVVRDDKTGERPVTHPADNLQLAPYLVAVGQVAHFGAKPIGEVANPRLGQLVRYEYQPGEVEALWQRFLRAADKLKVEPVQAEPGGHCFDCWERMRCDVRLLPAMKSPVMVEGLAPFTAGSDGLTAATAPLALRVVQAMKDVAERCDEHLRAWVLENGPIVDGTREWGPGMSDGRESADLKLLKADGLLRYIKKGKPYQTFRWRNRKDRP